MGGRIRAFLRVTGALARRLREPVSTVVELAGLAFLAWGAWRLRATLGIATVGLELLFIGFAVSPGPPRRRGDG